MTKQCMFFASCTKGHFYSKLFKSIIWAIYNSVCVMQQLFLSVILHVCCLINMKHTIICVCVLLKFQYNSQCVHIVDASLQLKVLLDNKDPGVPQGSMDVQGQMVPLGPMDPKEVMVFEVGKVFFVEQNIIVFFSLHIP